MEVAWLGGLRTCQELKHLVGKYQDASWRRQNHFSRTAAKQFLRERYPQLRACPLDLEQLRRVFARFPEQPDWTCREFDLLRLWQDCRDPEEQEARRQATRAERTG